MRIYSGIPQVSWENAKVVKRDFGKESEGGGGQRKDVHNKSINYNCSIICLVNVLRRNWEVINGVYLGKIFMCVN